MNGTKEIFTTASVVGVASESVWTQVHCYSPTRTKLDSHGSLLLAVCVRNQSSDITDLASVGKEIIDQIQDNYYGDSLESYSPLTSLTESIAEIVHDAGSFSVEVVAGVLRRSDESKTTMELSLVSAGFSSVVLLRSGKMYRLLPEDQTGASRQTVRNSQGIMIPSDILLLGTGDFFKAVSADDLYQGLSTQQPSEASSFFAPLVHGTDQYHGAAAIIACFDESNYHQEEDFEQVTQDRSDHERSRQSFFSADSVSFPGRFGSAFAPVGTLLTKIFRRPQRVYSQDMGTVDSRSAQRKTRLMYSVAGVVLFLLFASVFFGWRHRMKQKRLEAFSSVWEIADHQYAEALSLADLNPLRARALLSEAQISLDGTIADEGLGFSDTQKTQLAERADELVRALAQISGEYRVEEAEIFLDLTLVRPDTRGDVIDLFGDILVILDRQSGVLLRIDASNKSAETVGGGTLLNDSSHVAVTSGRGYVLSSSGVVEVSLAQKTSALVIEDDSAWGEIVDLAAFSGNIYLLDRGNGDIYRYQSSEGGFGSRRRWLGSGVFPDFSSARSLTIDGDIWVLTTDSVLRFRRGVSENFRISGLDVPFTDPIAIFTESDSERVFVLDRGNTRVVVFDKGGEYRSQYLWEGIASVSDMVVHEEEGKIFLLSGKLIYSIPLRE